jgi:Na+/H+-dicarboxylate symporter
MIPNSIFKAFTENKTLAILFFGILFAFVLRRIDGKRKVTITEALKAFHDIFFIVFKLSYYILPFGLFSLMVGQASVFTENTGLVEAYFKLVVCQGIILLAWFVIAVAVSRWKVPMRFGAYLSLIKKPMLIFFSLLSTLATLPAVMEVCEKEKAFDDENIKGTLPLLQIMMIPTIASIFSLTVVFLVQLLVIDIGPAGYLFIIITSMVAGFAASGIPAPADLYSISIVTAPLGIPVTQAIFFLLPYTLTGARVDSAFCVMLNFGVAQFFKEKTGVPKEARKVDIGKQEA